MKIITIQGDIYITDRIDVDTLHVDPKTLFFTDKSDNRLKSIPLVNIVRIEEE